MRIIVLDSDHARKFNSLYNGDVQRFDEQGVVCLAAVDNEVMPPVPCGMLVASAVEQSMNIEWLYVAEGYRRKGVATELVDTLMAAAAKCGSDHVFGTFSERNDGMAEFMDAFGFHVRHSYGWHDYVMKLSDFQPLPEEAADEYALESLFHASKKELAEMNAALEKSENIVGVPLPVDPRDYSPVSVCVKKDGAISGLLLVRTDTAGEDVRIEFPWVFFKKECIKAMPSVYSLVLKTLKALYPENTEIHFETLNPGMDSVIEKLAPQAEFKELYSAHWAFV